MGGHLVKFPVAARFYRDSTKAGAFYYSRQMDRSGLFMHPHNRGGYEPKVTAPCLRPDAHARCRIDGGNPRARRSRERGHENRKDGERYRVRRTFDDNA